MASNHAEACAAMRPGCTDEGVCDCGYLDSVMREGYQQDYSTPPPAEMCPVCKSVERVGTCPNDYHVPVRCSKCGKEVAYTSNIIGLVVVCAICELYETHPKSAEPAAPSYVCNCGQSFAHEYDRLLHAGDCPSVRKPAAEVRAPMDMRQIRMRLAEWNHMAFSNRELYEDCETLLAAYDAVCAQLRKANEWAYSLESQVSALKADNERLENLVVDLDRDEEFMRLTRELDTMDKAFIERSAERDEARAECERLRATWEQDLQAREKNMANYIKELKSENERLREACKRNPSSGSCIDALKTE